MDNQEALVGRIGGAMPAEDLTAVAALYQLLCVSLGLSIWLEYVESEANAGDGPSRLLEKWENTPLCKAMKCRLEPSRLPDLTSLFTAPAEVLSSFPIARDL